MIKPIYVKILLLMVTMYLLYKAYYYNTVWDFAKIHYARPHKVFSPETIEDIKEIINKHPNKPISIVGGGYSHGGQTLIDDGIYLDMKKFNKIISLDDDLLQVQSGCTWEKIIIYLDQYNLSVSEMQSYYNFTVGGSVSVNCHGRGMLYGTISDSVKNMTLLTSTGKIIISDRNNNFDIFSATIGGYGGIAIILHVTLRVTQNFPIKRIIIKTNNNSIKKFLKQIRKDKRIIFYNGNIYPKNKEDIINVCWIKDDEKNLTCTDRIQPKENTHFGSMMMEQMLRRFDSVKIIRSELEPKLLETNSVVYKNYEMSYDVDALQPLLKFPTTTILQEYFIPLDNIEIFLEYFWDIMEEYNVNILNVSLRYVKKAVIPILNYSPNDRIAVVLYINIGNIDYSVTYASQWSRLLIQKSIDLGGSYYLPYLPFATKEQFRTAYPNYKKYLEIKKKIDPMNRLNNQFLEYYLK
jgi:FAD/FMN-containing dehydrogenase